MWNSFSWTNESREKCKGIFRKSDCMPFKAIKTLIFLPFLFPFPADCKQQKQMLLLEVGLSYLDPEDRFFFWNCVISVISIVLRKRTLTISNLTGEPVSMESETVRVVSLTTMEKAEITQLKILSSGSIYLKIKPNQTLGPYLLIFSFIWDFDSTFNVDFKGGPSDLGTTILQKY